METTTVAAGAPSPLRASTARQLLNKVPEVTLYFWIIKILATTVGETAADYLNETVGLGLSGTTLAASVVLAIGLLFQFGTKKYVPGIYWFAVVAISIVGTLITDTMVDSFGISLVTSTIGFAIALTATFGVWYRSERTLSIHTIVTSRREGFYWLTVLFTFALGTATGDLLAEKVNIGYVASAAVFGGAIAVVYLAHLRFGLKAIPAFWIAYVLTRPLGASIGDYLSQEKPDGGLGLGTTGTSLIFLSTILALVVFLTLTRRDATEVMRPDLVVEDDAITA